eukprot:TRINITY_DN35965_c1_g2_i1.p1 TRINITY_DN35965_c1_g2~~TRINITY_DN35965_c1_g2_i1.p1  ORF type:complete len:1112 (-),score=204.83 TRINITY_DN35965_c1_g2_i1:236-3571(-)
MAAATAKPVHGWRDRRRAATASGGAACQGSGAGGDRGDAFRPASRVPAAGGSEDRKKKVLAGWELIEGLQQDFENEEVREQHRLCAQIGLLGQGTPQGYTDHEFPPQARSVDGLQGPAVKKGQELLIELITTQRPSIEEDDEADHQVIIDAPRCSCGRRCRQNRVRIPGPAFGRPYFRCAGRTCRMLTFGDLASTVDAEALKWIRFQTATGLQGGGSLSSRCVVVGAEGYRPEDARSGPDAEAMEAWFVAVCSVLAERPIALSRLLPNVRLPAKGSGVATDVGDVGGGGCHEVRLCVDGRWRSYLIDERLPTRAASQDADDGTSARSASQRSQHRHQELAFGRAAGNQLWLPLLEKAYAKAYGAYQLALIGASVDEIFADLTGAPVETLHLDAAQRHASFDDYADALWEQLQRLLGAGHLLACTCRLAKVTMLTMLGTAEGEDLALAAPSAASLDWKRAIRFRNPRGSSQMDASTTREQLLGTLGGVAAETSTYSDGSFWVSFPHAFLVGFKRIDVCQSADTGGCLTNSRVFPAEFTPERGLGIRGGAVQLRNPSDQPIDCWLTVAQATPRGARLLRPAMGRVFCDLGVVVLKNAGDDSCSMETASLGGSWPSTVCRLSLVPGADYVVVPVSFRAWPGDVTLRVQTNAPVKARSTPSEPLTERTWDALLRAADDTFDALAASPASGLASLAPSESRHSRVRSQRLPLRAAPQLSGAASLRLLEWQGAALLIVENAHPRHGMLLEGSLDASHGCVITSRAMQFGEWLGASRDGPDDAAHRSAVEPWQTSDWRRYAIEDVIPPASRQLICVVSGVARELWAVAPAAFQGKLLPQEKISKRPASHAFAPRPLKRSGDASPAPGDVQPSGSDPITADVGADHTSSGGAADNDWELRYALELSLRDVQQNAASVMEPSAQPVAHDGRGARAGRWGRRGAAQQRILAPEGCSICGDAAAASAAGPAPLDCCGSAVCAACASHWAETCVMEQGTAKVACPACSKTLESRVVVALLSSRAVRVLQRLQDAEASPIHAEPPSEDSLGINAAQLAKLGFKRCPSCGTGTQKEIETCHKMICRICRAKFCFRCLARLEYFNCGCTGPEHRFVDPVDGRTVAH